MATDCIPSIRDSDVIFRGKVKALHFLKEPQDGNGKRLQDAHALFDVLETYKGSPGSVADVYFYSFSATSEGYRAKGETSWVYAQWNADRKRYEQGFCSMNRHPDDLAK